jgi:catechol 2,3-dioxygenase-like lactoylglutathione lyase family enzyme
MTTTTTTILGQQKMVAFVSTASPAQAKQFYQDTLGLRLVQESPFALEFDAHGTMLRVTIVERAVIAPYTVLGWNVSDVVATVEKLRQAGVKFSRYPGMDQDKQDIWTSPSGARIAWFKDPDGNTLSVTQF